MNYPAALQPLIDALQINNPRTSIVVEPTLNDGTHWSISIGAMSMVSLAPAFKSWPEVKVFSAQVMSPYTTVLVTVKSKLHD